MNVGQDMCMRECILDLGCKKIQNKKEKYSYVAHCSPYLRYFATSSLSFFICASFSLPRVLQKSSHSPQ